MTTSPTLEAIETEHDVEFTLRYGMGETVGSADSGYHPDLNTWNVELIASKYDGDTDNESSSTVVKMVLHSVDIEWGSDEEALLAFDSYSDGIGSLAAATMDKWGFVTRVIAVDTVEVNEEYRGKGIAPIILTKALHRIGGNTFSAILEASPFYPEEMTAEEVKAAKKALSGMWKRAGFTKVKGDYYILERRDPERSGNRTEGAGQPSQETQGVTLNREAAHLPTNSRWRVRRASEEAAL